LPLSAEELQVNTDHRTSSDHHKFAYVFSITIFPDSNNVTMYELRAIKISVLTHQMFRPFVWFDGFQMPLLFAEVLSRSCQLYTWTYAEGYTSLAATHWLSWYLPHAYQLYHFQTQSNVTPNVCNCHYEATQRASPDRPYVSETN
jgi:hypothetical protein